MQAQHRQKHHILFLCTGNSCRSQMAEAWVRELRGEAFISHSAGVDPSGLNPFAVQVMAEVGVDLGGQASVHIEDVALDQLDTIVSVCDHARESCPQLPNQVQLVHRPFDDPPVLAKTAENEEQALGHYRRVRDEIREYVANLPTDLGSVNGPS